MHLFQLLLHQLHLRPSGIRSRSWGPLRQRTLINTWHLGTETQNHRLGAQMQDSPRSPAHSCPPRSPVLTGTPLVCPGETACKAEAPGCPPCPRPPGKGDGEGGYLLTLSNPQPTEPYSQAGLALHSARSPVIKVITNLFLLLAHCPQQRSIPTPTLTASSLPGLNHKHGVPKQGLSPEACWQMD